MHTIIVTGGHHNSALVVAKDLVARGHKVVWIGHRRSSRADTSDSAEYIEVTSAGIPFHDLIAGKLVLSFREFVRFPLGLYHALELIRRAKPTAILSFGGYLGGTVALAGYLLGIPIYLHEQTVTAGRSNRFIGALARKVYLTWGDSASYFPPSKVVLTGLPLRPGVLASKKLSLFTRRKPLLLIMGGKQGAHVLNQFIFTHLSDLLDHFNIVHQTGSTTETRDYETAVARLDSLGSLSDCYLPLAYISEHDIGGYLHSADYYLGRSGAHICYELALLSLPSILVPLMTTHDHEQHKNANILVSAGLAIILVQSELSLPHFMQAFKELGHLTYHPLDLPRDGSTTLIDHLLHELK